MSDSKKLSSANPASDEEKIELADKTKLGSPVKKSSLWGLFGKQHNEATANSRLAIYGTEKRKGKDADVDKQTEQSQQAGSIWNAVLTADAAVIDKIVKARPAVLDERGPVGETPIHLLFLYNSPAHQAIAVDLINRFPHIITHAYEGPLYKGETCLHLAIVHKEMHLVKFLLERNKELLKLPATGIFFSLAKTPGEKDGDCYYGEFPLAFAACTNNKPMVDYLLSQGADIFMQDSNQNTILHLLVRMRFKDMYEYIESKIRVIRDEWEAKKQGNPPPVLSKVRNKDGLTPLTLAATLGIAEEEVLRGDESMFSWIIEQQKKTQWTYGPVSCVLYPLDELDSLTEGDGPKMPSCLEIIVENKFFPLLMTEKVIRLLDKKWEMYARTRFRQRFYFTLAYFLILSVAVILRESIGSTFGRANYDALSSSRGIRLACEIIVLIGVIVKGFREFRELFTQGPKGYFGQSGSAFLENFLSFSYVITIVIVIILRVTESRAEDFFLLLAVLLVGLYMLALLLGFRLTGPYIIMISKMLANDVAKFLIIFAFLLWSFSTATYVMVDASIDDPNYYPGSDETPAPFEIWWIRVQLLGLSTLGQVSFDGFNTQVRDDYKPISSLLYLSYLISVTICLLNLLIAMMGNTMNAVADRANEEWHLAYAQIIMSIEGEMTNAERNDNSIKYWTNIGQERFLQIQGPYLLSYYNDNKENDNSKSASAINDKLLDANGDGVVSRAELKAYMENSFASGFADQQRRLIREALAESRTALEPPGRLGPQS